jgi:endonuclease/exonuclease/phosphatase family metal-dependent hydrolase
MPRSFPLLLLLSLLAAACEPPAHRWESREPVPVISREGRWQPPEAPSPLRLKVMTWNIKYGAGRIDFWFDFWGDRVEMTRGEVEQNLEGAYALINEVRPDILMVQEIEVNSRRSAYVDMVRGILANTHLNNAAYVPTWDSRYIPSEGVGRMNLGNAVFSTFPIVSAERIPQEDRTDQDPLTRTFYIHRAVARAVLQVGTRQVAALTVHTEAYDTDGTKQKHLQQLQALLNEEPLPFVVGGDFNALPPTAVRTQHFNDEHPSSLGTEFEQPPYDVQEMAPFFRDYLPAIPLARMGTGEAEQRRYFTHSVIGPQTVGSAGEPGFWNRTLDYLFVRAPDAWVPGTTDVLQQVGDSGIRSNPLLLSDHCPTVGTWEVQP